MKRSDDFQARRGHLAGLSDQQLHERFWQLADQLVEPLLKMGREYTSPAIERSVLLRMGFSSLEAKQLVDGCADQQLLAHGAGHVVYRFARDQGLGIRQAGLKLATGEHWAQARELFKGGAAR
ncbi:MAG: ornithine aminomutase subunit alpha [Candidatus Xenobium sp.]|jgi:D-ornithine 4,5-aminomutase subunit alpha